MGTTENIKLEHVENENSLASLCVLWSDNDESYAAASSQYLLIRDSVMS